MYLFMHKFSYSVKVFFNPAPEGSFPACFSASSSADFDDQLIMKFCWGLITTQSFESGVLEQCNI